MANQAVLEKVLQDEAFVKELTEMQEPQQVCDALNAKGAEITVEEVQQIAKSLTAQVEGELDEDALEDVAGGSLWNVVTQAATIAVDLGRQLGVRW